MSGIDVRPQNEAKTRGTGNKITGESLPNNQTALHTIDKGKVTSIGTDVVDSIAGNIITAAAHSVRKNDLVRMTSGAASGVEFRVFAIATNTITLEGDGFDLSPSAADTFEFLRPITPTLTSTGGISSVNTFILDGSNQAVTEDTGTPANNRPLPVKLMDTGGNISIDIANQNLDVQLDHDSANPDSVQIGDGTNVAAVSAALDLQTEDTLGNAILTTMDVDTGVIAGAVSGTEMQVDIVSAGPIATEVTAAAILADTAAIDTNVATLAGTVSGTEQQVDIVASLPAGTNNIGDIDVLSSALPTGAATSALQTSSEALLTTIDADTSALAGTVAGTELQVDVLTSALPAGAATSALQTSSEAILTTIDADTSTLAGTVAGSEQQVDIVASLPAGSNTIGAVTIGALAVVDLIDDLGDGAGILFVANDNIDDSAGTFREIVASSAAEINKVEIRSTAGGFVGLFTGPGASEVLLSVFGPGEDQTLELGTIASTTRFSLRRMDSATVPLTAGFITMNFLG